jgi:hypothetical protein
MVTQFKRRIELSDLPPTVPSLPAKPSLLFCETERDVRQLVAEPTLRQQVDAVLALTPESAWACQQAGLEYLKTEDFCPETAFRDISESMLTFQAGWSDEVDAALMGAVPELAEYDFRPARLHFFFLKILIDQLFMRAFALGHVLAGTQPRRILYFPERNSQPLSWDLFFRESVWSLLLPLCARSYGVPITQLPAAAELGSMPIAGKLKRLVPEAIKRRLLDLRAMGWRAFLSSYTAASGRLSILLKPGYDLALLVRNTRCDGISIIPFSRVPAGRADSNLTQRLSDVWPMIITEPSFRAAFVWAGTDVLDAATTRLQYFATKVIPEMWQSFVQARHWLAQRRPAAVGVSSPWEHRDQSIMHAARTLKLPTFTFQHGGFEGNCEYIAHEMTDLRHADYRLVYGRGVETYLQQRIDRYPEKRAQLITVGSPRLDALAREMRATDVAKLRQSLNIRPEQPVVLYVPTAFTRNHNYLVCGSYPDVPYFEFLQQILGLSLEFPHVKFVYKSFPSREPDPVVQTIAQRYPNVQTINDIPLSLLFAAADVHLFDIASTGLLESLLIDKPIFVLSDPRYVILRPEARALLEKRAAIAQNPEEFSDHIRRFLLQGDFAEVAKPNNEFLSAYGTHLCDGESLQRAITALEQIMDSGQSYGLEQTASVCQAK